MIVLYIWNENLKKLFPPRDTYPQGWAQGPMRDNTLEYRLSIIRAEEGDTGRFTCTTPFKQSHSINILVMNISCPVIIHTRGLVLSTNSTILNTKYFCKFIMFLSHIVLFRVQFSCNNGNTLLGPSSITCLPTGKESSKLVSNKIWIPTFTFTHEWLNFYYSRVQLVCNKIFPLFSHETFVWIQL